MRCITTILTAAVSIALLAYSRRVRRARAGRASKVEVPPGDHLGNRVQSQPVNDQAWEPLTHKNHRTTNGHQEPRDSFLHNLWHSPHFLDNLFHREVDAAKVVLEKKEAVLDAAQEAFGALPPLPQWKLGEPHTDVARKDRDNLISSHFAAKATAQQTIYAAEGEVMKARNRWEELIHREVLNRRLEDESASGDHLGHIAQPQASSNQTRQPPSDNDRGTTHGQQEPSISLLRSAWRSAWRNPQFTYDLFHQEVNAAKAVLENTRLHREVDGAKAELDKTQAVLYAAQEAFIALPPLPPWKLGEAHTDQAQKERQKIISSRVAAKADAQNAVYLAEGEVIRARDRRDELIHQEVMSTSSVIAG